MEEWLYILTYSINENTRYVITSHVKPPRKLKMCCIINLRMTNNLIVIHDSERHLMIIYKLITKKYHQFGKNCFIFFFKLEWTNTKYNSLAQFLWYSNMINIKIIAFMYLIQ